MPAPVIALWQTRRPPLFPLPAAPTRLRAVFAAQPPRPRRTAPPLTWRQKSLKNVPPARRTRKPFPPGLHAARVYLSERYHAGDGRGAEAKRLAAVLAQMTQDSVIFNGDWRLELVWLAEGYPHYRLYWQSYCVGGVDIPVDWHDGKTIADCPLLPRLQADLAAYLIGCGFQADLAARTHILGGAQTPHTARKRGLYDLLTPLPQGQDRAALAYDVLVACYTQLADTPLSETRHDALLIDLMALVLPAALMEEDERFVLDTALVNAVLALVVEHYIPRQPTLF